MIVSKKIKIFEFQGEDAKTTYLKGCKKVAKYIKQNNKFNNITYNVERTKNNIFKFTLYTSIDLNEEIKKQCIMCRETQNSFYNKEVIDCGKCKVKALIDRLECRLKISKQFYKENIK